MRPAFAHRADEHVDQFVVFGAAHAFVLPADIKRIGEVLLVVGAGVENDRQRGRRMQPGAGGVERQLADRNAHAAGALVTEAEDALAVADHDRLDGIKARMRKDARDQVFMRDAEKQPARFAENMAEQFAAAADRRRIEDRHQLFDVAGQKRVEQGFVGILQPAQKHIFLDVAAEAAKRLEPAHHLVIELGDVRRQQPVQVEFVPLGLGECRTFVQYRIVEQLIAAQRGFDMARWFIVRRFMHLPSRTPRYKQTTLAL